mmetsp:Transcript_56904/g.124826  ORF Transcript_56904/g.124826 Transcript_56904/m.124826 type:complete len:372 (-) Transcript_56904:219-1334(-)
MHIEIPRDESQESQELAVQIEQSFTDPMEAGGDPIVDIVANADDVVRVKQRTKTMQRRAGGSEVLSATFAQLVPGLPFADSFEKAPEKNFVFLIPGDEELFVGGGALNGAVGLKLQKDGKQPLGFSIDAKGEVEKIADQNTGKMVPKYDHQKCPYAKLHRFLYEKARRAKETVVEELSDFHGAPLLFASCRSYKDTAEPFGAAFLTIFKKVNRPYSPKNVGLCYTVGALGRNKRAEGEEAASAAREALVVKDKKKFLKEIFMTGTNCMALITHYNQKHANKKLADGTVLPRIEVFRSPIVAGGTFMHPDVTPEATALSLLWGYQAKVEDKSPALELMPEAAMKNAYQKIQDRVGPDSDMLYEEIEQELAEM